MDIEIGLTRKGRHALQTIINHETAVLNGTAILTVERDRILIHGSTNDQYQIKLAKPLETVSNSAIIAKPLPGKWRLHIANGQLCVNNEPLDHSKPRSVSPDSSDFAVVLNGKSYIQAIRTLHPFVGREEGLKAIAHIDGNLAVTDRQSIARIKFPSLNPDICFAVDLQDIPVIVKLFDVDEPIRLQSSEDYATYSTDEYMMTITQKHRRNKNLFERILQLIENATDDSYAVYEKDTLLGAMQSAKDEFIKYIDNYTGDTPVGTIQYQEFKESTATLNWHYVENGRFYLRYADGEQDGIVLDPKSYRGKTPKFLALPHQHVVSIINGLRAFGGEQLIKVTFINNSRILIHSGAIKYLLPNYREVVKRQRCS